MNSRRVLFLTLIALAAAAGLFSAGLQEQPADPAVPDAPAEPLTILAPETVSTIPFLSIAEDYPQSYTVEFFTDHPQALARLIQGDVDLLATGFNVGYTRYQDAGDLVHLVTPVWGVSALMTAQEVDGLADLAGGTIYAPFEGSPIDVYLRAILEEADLEDQVDVSYAPFPQAAGLLSEGRAEAAVLVEPIASRVEIAGTAYRLENLHEGWARVSGGEQRSPQVSVFAHRSRAGRLPDERMVLEERLREVVEDIRRDPRAYAEDFADTLGFPVPVVTRALENTLFEVPPREAVEELVADYARVMGLPEPGADLFQFSE